MNFLSTCKQWHSLAVQQSERFLEPVALLFLRFTVAKVFLDDQGEVVIHKHLHHPLKRLIGVAAASGFKLGVASAYRGFERQQWIWDSKVAGRLSVLDKSECPLAIQSLSPSEQVQAILRWSALPGASRHHWGTDFDIYDRGALPAGQPLALTLNEANTVFADFYCWLAEYLAQQNEFVRPYFGVNKGAIACEPWHLSFLPLAKHYEKIYTYEALQKQLIKADITLLDEVLKQLPAIYERYIAAYFSFDDC